MCPGGLHEFCVGPAGVKFTHTLSLYSVLLFIRLLSSYLCVCRYIFSITLSLSLPLSFCFCLCASHSLSYCLWDLSKAFHQIIRTKCVYANIGLFFCLVGFLTSSSTTRLYRGRAPRQERLTILRAATHETELGDHDFCLSRSHYTDTDANIGT